MKGRVIKKVLSLLVIFTLILQQTGFAQGIGQLDISKYIGAFSGPQQFRPLLLRYFSYDPLTDNFQLLLDKGNLKKLKNSQLKEQGQELLKYFLVGVVLPDDNFWVNLRPDSENQIISRELASTDLGKVLLEADLQLKKDVARFTSPETREGREYWNKLYAKAGQIFNSENITIPTLTRPWIVPGEVIIRENANSAYVYKGVLKVMLEQDHLKNSADYNFSDPRLKELNEYSSQLIRDKIIPKLTKEVNSSERYASLRQVFFSLILSRWFKHKFADKKGLSPQGTVPSYINLIDSQDLTNLTSKTPWSKTTYFKEYKKSFAQGEYNLKEQVNTVMGPTIRTYFSGGIAFQGELKMPTKGASSPLGTFLGSNPGVTRAIGKDMTSFTGTPTIADVVPNLQTKAWLEGSASSPVQIRTELTVPEGQKPGFFTNDYQGYVLSGLLAEPIEQIPDAAVNAVQKKLDQDIAEGKLLGAVVKDFGGTDIDIQVTHRYGEPNAAVQRLVLEAMKEGVLKAKELGLLKKDIDVTSMSLDDLARALRVKYQPHSITERGSEPVVIAKIVGAGIGAANIKLYHEFFMPGSTPLQKLGFVPVVDTTKKEKLPVRGFRAVVRRVDDVLKGNFNGPVWEFEKSAATEIDSKYYPSKDESLELLALASQPNDFVITAIYAVEGSLLSAKEPVVSVVYQPVYGESGNLRTLNPTFISKSQSGADAVGGIASMFYDVNFVPGGNNGEYYVATRPVTLKEARKAPREGTAHVVVYVWQSELNGVIPKEKGEVIDHVAINPPALGPERKLADFLASVMTTQPNDQPYLTPFAAQEQVELLRKDQSRLFSRAPKEADIDPVMDEVETRVASGRLLSVTNDKADMGGMAGHNYTPQYMLAIDKATVIEAQKEGMLSDGNIIGFTDKMRLKRGITTSIGDDSHILMLGDKSRNSAQSHQLSFLAFTRGYLASMVGNTSEFDPAQGFTKPKKPYGRGQDFAGKEAKAAMKNPYFYSQLNERFFAILRETMPQDYMQMIDNMEKGWRHWKETKEETALPDPFSGNVSQQGIGSARYLVDIAGGERSFGILAGDKMGPAALNRPIREGVYAALSAGEFANGLVFEIWDAKAYDEHGNIPIDELPELFADIADAVNELKEKADQDFVKNSYKDGLLRDDLSATDKEKLAQLIKESGFVPTKRIFLDAQQDKDAIFLYLADSDRFNIKQVWSKKTAGWDIHNFQPYLDKPVLGSSVTKLGILAGGEYIGKDDPVMVGDIRLMERIFEFLRTNPLIIQGDMNGSHWLAAIPTAFKYAVANKESHPILVGLAYTLSEGGKTLNTVEDIFGTKDYASIRNKMFKFNFEFKKAQLGGQFEPYGTNWRTVEASYPLAKLLRALQEPNSPFLVSNKPETERQSRPIGIVTETVELFKTATVASSSLSASDIAVAGNWKLRPFKDEGAARAKAREFRAKLAEIGTKVGIVLFVEDKWGKAISEELKGSNIAIGVQSFHFAPEGNIEAQIEDAVDRGFSVAMVGHSMHRNPDPKILSGVAPLTNEGANKIVKAILADGRLRLWYVIGVDEQPKSELILLSDEARRYQQELFIKQQIDDGVNVGLDGVLAEQLSNILITAEPTADISTKAGDGTIDPKTKVNFPKVDMLARHLSDALRVKFGSAAEKVNTGYGATAGPDTAETLLSHPAVFNILPGGKSLEADDFKATIVNAMKGKASSPVGLTKGQSPSIPEIGRTGTVPGKLGGIDFRAIPMITQPMGNLSGLSFSLPKLSNLENINLDEELEQIQKMLQAGITPSGARLKEFVAVCYQKGELSQYLDGIVRCLVDLCKLEEEKVDASANELKEVLLILDSIS